MAGGKDIDSLKFSIVLDSSKFETEMKRVEKLAKTFEESVSHALAITNLLDAAQSKGAKGAKEKAKAAKEVVLLTRQELEAKKAAGTITDKELKQLKQIIAADKALLDEENKRLTAEKKQLDIENKKLLLKKRQKSATEEEGAAIEHNTSRLFQQNGILKGIGTYVAQYASIFGAVRLAQNLVRITGEFEAQHVALRAILQDVAAADRIFYQLQELAVKSPFTFRNLTDYAKQLSAFSVPIDEIYETTKRLADVSAGLGVDMGRIILAYGQIRSASFLRGQEVRQLTEAGIPVLEELAKQFREIEGEAISVGKVFDKISARQVPFEMIEKMFHDLTSEGGKFYQMQEVLAETVKGKISNLQDAWEIMLSKVGEDNDVFIKGVIDGVTNLVKNYKDLSAVLGTCAVAYGTYRIAVIAATQAEAMQGIVMAATGKRISALSALITRLVIMIRNIPAGIAGIVSKLNPWALGIAAVGAAITALIIHQRRMNEHLRETDKLTQKAIASAEASKSNIHYYIERLKEAKEGTEEYNQARQAVIDNSGSYISATDAERLSLENVDAVWVSICNHIEEATKLQAMQSVTAEAAASKQETQLKIMDALAQYQQENNLSNEVRQNIAAFIRREITEDELKRRLAGKVSEGSGGYYSPGSMSDIIYKAGNWWDEYYAADRRYYESINRAKQNLNDLTGSFEKNEEKAEVVLDGWRKRVNDYITSVEGGTRGVKISGETNLADFVKGGAEALDDLRKARDLTPKNEADYKKIEKDIEFWEKVSEAIYGSGKTEFGNTTKFTKSSRKSADEQRRELIASLKQEFQDLKELKSHYDRLKILGVSDKQINEYLGEFFGRGVPNGGFKSAFENVALGLESLGDSDSARDVRNYAAGKDVGTYIKKMEDAADAVKKWNEAVEDLQASTRRLNLDGFAAELDKILVDTDSKNRKLRTDWDQKERELEESKDGWIAQYRIKNEKATAEEAEKAWRDFFDKQKAEAKKSIDEQIAYNNKSAQIQIDKKADDWVRTVLEREGIELSDWADKTPAQIEEIREKLEMLRANFGELLPEELFDDADKINATFENLLKLIDEILKNKIKVTVDEKSKKDLEQLTKDLKSIGTYLGKIGSAVSKFGGDWEGVGGALSDAGSNISSLADINQKYQSGQMSKGGATFSYIMIAVENIVSTTARAIENFREMKEATEAWNLALKESEYELENLQLAHYGYSQKNVFGVENPYSKALAASEQLRKAQEKLLGLTKEISEIQVKTGQKKAQDWGDTTKTVLEMTAAGAAIGTVAGGGVFSWAGVLIGAAAGFLTGVVTAAFTSKKMVDVFESLGDITGGQIFDPQTLELSDEVLAKYNQMDEAGKALVDHWKEIKDLMKEAIDTFNENVEAVVGDIGDSIKEMLVNAFNNGDVYGAIDDLHDYIGDTIQSLIMDIAFSKALQPLFDELEKDMRHSFGLDENGNPLEKIDERVDYDWVDDLIRFNQGLEGALPAWEAAMDGAQSALEMLGYTWNTGSGDSSNSLGNGIKSITEDTANLLASYINAIRADVSYIRVMEEKGWGSVAVIGSSIPTLAEYLSQVAANTFDTSQNTQRILSELQNVIGAPGTSGMVVRVEAN